MSEYLKKLTLGDKLYSYKTFKGIFDYEVIGLIERKDVIMYEMKCLKCADHKDCIIIVILDPSKKYFNFVSMIDDDENRQSSWHQYDHYYLTPKECSEERKRKIISEAKIELEKTRKSVEYQEKKLAEYQELVCTDEGFENA